MRKRLALTAALTAMAAMAACGGGGSGGGDGATSPSPTAGSTPRPASPAELRIVSPRNGDVIRGSSVDLRIDLNGARIVAQTTTDIAPDEGHIHVLLDDTLISMTEGLEQSIPDVERGSHRITVEFVASDHVGFDPRVVTVVAFEVRP